VLHHVCAEDEEIICIDIVSTFTPIHISQNANVPYRSVSIPM
jgi:hypothetical protein